MIQCPSCGAENPGVARFCAVCGAALGAQPRPTQTAASRKLVTIVFIDAVGSTQLGEDLDPETIRTVMARYFGVIQPIVEAHGGIVEKFIGDAVMAAFGIPVVHEDDALRAVRAAAEIQVALRRLDDDLSATNGITIHFRTGINTGEVVAGDHTSGQTFATGDTVNTAARIEAAASSGEVLLGRSTYLLVRDAVSADQVGPIDAKGKAGPVDAYRLLSVDIERAGHERRLDRPMIGRSRELAVLRDAFEGVVAERACRVVTLIAPAGVGKSRLVAEVADGVGPVATVLRGRCLSYGSSITYWPIGEIVRAAAAIRESESAAEGRSKILGLLGDREDAGIIAARVASAIGLSTDVAPQEEVFWAIRKLLEHLARDRPLVVVLEDIHWAETVLLECIEHLAGWSRDVPILVLCTARPEVVEIRDGWGDASPGSMTMTLEPLDESAMSQLITGLPGGSALPAAVEARLAIAAEGNPLFIEEFLGMLVDDGLLAEAADGVWTAADSIESVRMPPSVKALLSARLERLAPEERAVAERASVVGRVFEQAAVAELADDALRPRVGHSLLALVRKELVRRERSALSDGDSFKFRHILIRDAAYDALPKTERAVLHERFADWLERTIGERLAEYEEILGYHLEQAHRYRIELGETGDRVTSLAERAGTHLTAAGGRASERGDLHSAIALLERAAALIPAGRQRIRLLIDLRSTLQMSGDGDAADTVHAEVVALLDAYPDEGLVHRSRLAAAIVTFEGTPDESAESFAYYERIGDLPGMIQALQVMMWALVFRGRFTAAAEVQERATTLAMAHGRSDLAVGVVRSWAPSLVDSPLTVPEALRRSRAMLDLVGEDRQGRILVLLAIGGLESMSGVGETWRHPFDDAKAIIDDLGLVVPIGAATYPVNVADAELTAGDPARVIDLLRTSCQTLERLGLSSQLASLAPLTAQTLLALGQLEEVERYARRGRELAAPDDLDANARWRNALSGLRTVQGRHAEAIELARDSVAIMADSDFMDSRMVGHMAVARALRAAGDESGAIEAASLAHALAAGRENMTAIRAIAGFLGS